MKILGSNEHLGKEQHLGDVPANSEDCKSATTPVDPQDKHVNAHRPQPHKHGHVGGNTPTGRTPDYAPQPLPPPRLTGEGAVRIPRARRRRVERARRLAERARRRRVAKGVLTADAAHFRRVLRLLPMVARRHLVDDVLGIAQAWTSNCAGRQGECARRWSSRGGG